MVKTVKNKNKEINFEEALKKLEYIVSKMESGSIPLEKALSMYEEGIEISQLCLKELDKAEVKLKKLTKKLDNRFEIENEDDEDDTNDEENEEDEYDEEEN
jgi:exodeoxyribonuclease VII small subunit